MEMNRPAWIAPQNGPHRTQVGCGTVVWFAYRNGDMLRDKRGVGRRFKSEAAAAKALKEK